MSTCIVLALASCGSRDDSSPADKSTRSASEQSVGAADKTIPREPVRGEAPRAGLKEYQVTAQELAGKTVEGPLNCYIKFLSKDKFELVTRNADDTYRGTYKVERNAENMSVIKLDYKSKTGPQKATYGYARGQDGVIMLTLAERTSEDLPAWFK